MKHDDEEFSRFIVEREQAARAFVNGNVDLLNAMVASALAVTFFEPGGAVISGAEAVRDRYRTNAARFSDGTYSFEILHAEASGPIGYVVGIQRGAARVAGRPTSLDLRVTEVFRREGGAWKLVHRHADPVVD